MKFSFSRIVITLGIFSTLLVLQTGCQQEASIEIRKKTIARWISDERATYSILDSALRLTGLLDTLNTTGPFTMLVPDNTAFGIFNSNGRLDWPFGVPLLRNNMIFHILPGIKKEADLPVGPNGVILTLTGDSAFASKNVRGVFINGSRIVPDAYNASNGVIHKISEMQIAADGNVMETLNALLGMDSLRKAINRIVSAPGGDPGFMTLLSTARVTLFAPEDQAFRSLMQSLSLTDINQIPVSQLRLILHYQVIPGKVFMPDLPEGGQPTIGGGAISIHWASQMQDIPFITGTGNAGANIGLIKSNILCYNGIIHVTSNVLLP